MWSLMVVLACISLMTKDGEHPSTCVWAVCVTSRVPVHFCTFIFLMDFRTGSHSHKHNLQLLPWLAFNVWISLAWGGACGLTSPWIPLWVPGSAHFLLSAPHPVAPSVTHT